MSAKICGLVHILHANILEANQSGSIFRKWIQDLDCNLTHWNHKTKLSACTIVPEMLNFAKKTVEFSKKTGVVTIKLYDLPSGFFS